MDNGDDLTFWIDRYLNEAVMPRRKPDVVDKIALHLGRFADYLDASYGQSRVSIIVQRDVRLWLEKLQRQDFAPATLNNHLASLSAFATWLEKTAPGLFPKGDPTKGIPVFRLPPLEPRALNAMQVRSLKNLCDRLESVYKLKGRRHAGGAKRVHGRARPKRDRAMIFMFLSTGLRREELVSLQLDQIVPNVPSALRRSRKANVNRVIGKGKSERTVFLSKDARLALAEYLEEERPVDVTPASRAVFLVASGIPQRREDGSMSVRSINDLLTKIGRLHDAEYADPDRHISPLRPHDLRHTFAFMLSRETGADAFELERRLGHRSQRYIQRYTNPPEEVAAGYIEDF